MVMLDHDPDEADLPAQYYYGECNSLLTGCCSKTRLSVPLKFRTMNKRRRQMAYEMLRQMKQQQRIETLPTRSKRQRDKKCFYRRLCCTELHISESQASVYSSSMAAATRYKSRIPSTGLTNELYFASHKPDGDNERTPPALLRNRRRTPQSTVAPTDGTPSISTTHRAISSPVRSTTYVLQQHHRISNQSMARKSSSPVQHHPSSSPSVTSTPLNKSRQTPQQRTYSNHERLPVPTITADPSVAHQQFTSRAQVTLAPRRTSPIVRNAPSKPTTLAGYSSRPPVRGSRPSPVPHAPVIPSRSPRVQIRPPSAAAAIASPVTQRTISSSPNTNANKVNRPRFAFSKSPEPLRSVTGSVARPRPGHTVVNKVKATAINSTSNPTRAGTSAFARQPSSTARVSDLDALMAEKRMNTKTPPEKSSTPSTKSSHITPSPLANNIRCSLFSTDAVKVVRPVRSQELKLFSCHLTSDSSTLMPISDEISSESNIDETLSTLTAPSSEYHPDEQTTDDNNNDDTSSNRSVIIRELSADSLNEHHHIRQLLKSNASIAATNNDSVSNDDIPTSSAVTSWSRIRSSCESSLSQIAPLQSDVSTSPACYRGPVRQEDIQLASDGRYFLLFDDNITSEASEATSSSSSSSSTSTSSDSASISPYLPIQRPSLVHRLVFPERLGRIIFYRRILSDSDIYQKLCSKDNEIRHNVYHLDTIRDYSMEFYMLTTYASDSQLRAWFDSNGDDTVNSTCYFDDHRFQSLDDDDDEDDCKEENDKHREDPLNEPRMRIASSSSESIIRDDELNRLQADEELDWYSELESFNLLPAEQQWKNENVSSCSSDEHVGALLRAEQFSVSSLTTTTSAESSSSAGLVSTSWPLANDSHEQEHSHRSSQSLGTPSPSNVHQQSNTILKEILSYPWSYEASNSGHELAELDKNPLDSVRTASVVSDEFQPDFYYLCPLKNTTSFVQTDEKLNGIPRQYSHDV